MSNTALGLGIVAVITAIIGYTMFRGARAKATTGNRGGDAPWSGSGDGGHGHGDGGGDGGGGGD
jgi:hypothetical protein